MMVHWQVVEVVCQFCRIVRLLADVVNCCSEISIAFVSSQDIPKYLVSMSYHANRFPFGMSTLKTW